MNLGLFAQLTVSGFVVGSMYALLGVSFGIIYATTKIFHMAHAVVYAAAAYTAVWSSETLGLSLLPACLVGLFVGVLFGLLIELGAYRPMRTRNASLMTIFLVSLGISVAFPNLLQLIFGPDNRAAPGFSNPIYELGAVTISRHDILTVAVAWPLIFAVIALIARTRFGRSVTAMRTNPMMAAAVGIDSGTVYLAVFGIGSLLVSVAGLLFLTDAVASPTMGSTPMLSGLIAAFLGGIGSLSGAAMGGLFLGLVSGWSALFLQINYGPIVVFGAMFLLLLVRPQGLLGKTGV